MTTDPVFSALIPPPRHVAVQEGRFTFNKTMPVTADFADAARLRYLLSLCGITAAPAATTVNDEAEILHLAIGKIAAGTVSGLAPTLPGDEAYALCLEPQAVRLAARTVAGLAMGLKTLAKILADTSTPPCAEIQDAPAFEFRGVHLCLFRPDDGTEKEASDPESIRKMLLLAAMAGYKYVAMEFWGMFPYQRRPYAVWPNKIYPMETVKELIRYAIDDLHLIPIPCQNLTSHAGWSRMISRKHVVLDQRPDLAAMFIPGGWCFATENPDTKKYLADIMEELLEAYRLPPFLHASCDKCFGFGSTEQDRTKSADLLFGNHLSFLNTFLQERGTRMIMWADMLYTSMDSLTWKASPALADMLPRNILMNLWTHNDPSQHWPDVDFFQKRGFQTIYSPFLEEPGIRSMVDVCARHASYGVLQTTWHKPVTARNAVVMSGAMQWRGRPATVQNSEAFVERWYTCR